MKRSSRKGKRAREARQDHPWLADRLALRIEEAAASIGLSEGAFSAHILPRCPKLYAGRAVVIPKRLFERFLETCALEEGKVVGDSVEDLLHAIEVDRGQDPSSE